jgi:hypothetical protein
MDESADTTRRRFLGLGAAAAGAVAVTAVEGIAPSPAVASDGDPVLLAATNQANNPTIIEIVDSGQPGLHVIARADDGALIGENTASDGYGVRATGDYIGLNAVGGDIGVYTVSDYGIGLRALTYDGVALETSTAVDAGHALRVLGAAHFSRSGVATVGSGQRSVTVAAGTRAGSSVLATIQDRQAGCLIEAAVPDPQAGTITIWLNKATRGAMRIAWLLLD